MMEGKANETRWWIGLGAAAVVYNVIAFALPFGKTAVFFLSWIFTMAAIAAQVYVIRTAFFKGEGIKSKLYGFPIARVGLLYLAVQVVLGLIFMALGTVVPFWLPLVLYVILMGAALIGLITTEGAREEVERVRRRLRQHSQLDECRGALRRQEEELEQLTAHLVQLSAALGQVSRLSQRTERRNTDRLEEDGRPRRALVPMAVRVVDGVYRAKIQQILHHP